MRNPPGSARMGHQSGHVRIPATQFNRFFALASKSHFLQLQCWILRRQDKGDSSGTLSRFRCVVHSFRVVTTRIGNEEGHRKHRSQQ
jgi:hypothetical protein